MHQTMLLGKKEWSLNPGIASDPLTVDQKSEDKDFNDLA